MFKNIDVNEDGVEEVHSDELQANADNIEIIDVRRADEFNAELGHIDGAKLCTLETDFQAALPTFDKDKTYVFVCRSGRRSADATQMARDHGIEKSYNLFGGMMRWNAQGLPVSR